MKRTPLQRKTPLKAKSELKAKTAWLSRSELPRRTRLRARSAKTEKVYEERRELVSRLLRERPRCQVKACSRRSADIHEPKTRARGGSILDESNCLAVCRECHGVIHDNPKWAEQEGYLIHSWD